MGCKPSKSFSEKALAGTALLLFVRIRNSIFFKKKKQVGRIRSDLFCWVRFYAILSFLWEIREMTEVVTVKQTPMYTVTEWATKRL